MNHGVALISYKTIRISFHRLLHYRMPKTKKKPVLEQKGHKDLQATANGAVYCDAKNEIIIKIHAKPGAKESGITDIGDESVGVQISAPPVDGEANKELIRYLGEVLSLRKSQLSLEKGSRSKEKTVVISSGSTTLEVVLEKLKMASKQ